MRQKVICMISLMAFSIQSFAIETDPVLTGAVGTQTAMLKSLFNKREKTQQKILAAEAAVTVAMDRMHRVEDQMLEYLQNAQGAMQNLYQIKRAAELVTTGDSSEHESRQAVTAWSSERNGYRHAGF